MTKKKTTKKKTTKKKTTKKPTTSKKEETMKVIAAPSYNISFDEVDANRLDAVRRLAGAINTLAIALAPPAVNIMDSTFYTVKDGPPALSIHSKDFTKIADGRSRGKEEIK